MSVTILKAFCDIYKLQASWPAGLIRSANVLITKRPLQVLTTVDYLYLFLL